MSESDGDNVATEDGQNEQLEVKPKKKPRYESDHDFTIQVFDPKQGDGRAGFLRYLWADWRPSKSGAGGKPYLSFLDPAVGLRYILWPRDGSRYPRPGLLTELVNREIARVKRIEAKEG